MRCAAASGDVFLEQPVVFVKDFTLDMTLTQPSPCVIRLTRITHGPRDQERFQVTWTVTPAGDGAQIAGPGMVRTDESPAPFSSDSEPTADGGGPPHSSTRRRIVSRARGSFVSPMSG